jgi:hypothetical protein
MPRTKLATLLSLATLFSPALFAQGMNPARPGTLNYIEGHAALDGAAVSQSSIGSLAMNAGQTLATSDGHAEVLLTPGVFLRLDHDSTVKMVSPNLTHTEVEVDRGRADLEVDALYKQNNLLVDEGPTQTAVLKNGLYEFDASADELKVFQGKAAVSASEDANKWVDVKAGHELALTAAAGTKADKEQSFDKKGAEDDLYNWSSLRADYLGQANARLLAEGYAGESNYAPGWAWDPGFYGYTWLPYDGFLYSPFGFGFYSPAFFYGGGFGYGGYRGGFAGRGGFGGGFAGRTVGGEGFHGGGGGFHGGGGGFHGGGGHR